MAAQLRALGENLLMGRAQAIAELEAPAHDQGALEVTATSYQPTNMALLAAHIDRTFLTTQRSQAAMRAA